MMISWKEATQAAAAKSMSNSARTTMVHMLVHRNYPFTKVHHNASPKFKAAPQLDPHTGVQVGWDYIRTGLPSKTIYRDPTPATRKRSWDLNYDPINDGPFEPFGTKLTKEKRNGSRPSIKRR